MSIYTNYPTVTHLDYTCHYANLWLWLITLTFMEKISLINANNSAKTYKMTEYTEILRGRTFYIKHATRFRVIISSGIHLPYTALNSRVNSIGSCLWERSYLELEVRWILWKFYGFNRILRPYLPKHRFRTYDQRATTNSTEIVTYP